MFFFIHQHIVDWVIWWFFNPMSRKGFSDISTHKLLHQTHKYLEVRRVSVCIFKEHKGSSDGWFRNYLYFLDDSCKQIRRVKSQASTIPLCNRFIRWYHSVVFDTMLFFFFIKNLTLILHMRDVIVLNGWWCHVCGQVLLLWHFFLKNLFHE